MLNGTVAVACSIIRSPGSGIRNAAPKLWRVFVSYLRIGSAPGKNRTSAKPFSCRSARPSLAVPAASSLVSASPLLFAGELDAGLTYFWMATTAVWRWIGILD
nr:hypothetical protein CFP56_20258 [Quercus suber]